MAISKWDEYLIHQTYDTFDTGTVDCDRCIMHCHNTDGTLHLTAGLGAYPKNNVMDAYVCVRHEGTQHNLRLSRHLNGDRADMVVGPLSFKVIEPLKRWGLYVDENDYGVSCSIEFEGRVAPYLALKKAYEHTPFCHYFQPGRYTGRITLGDEHFDVDGFIGSRDRSWRIYMEKVYADGGTGSFGGYFWIQVHFETFCVSLVATPYWNVNPFCYGAILNDDGSVIRITEMRHRIEFIPTAKRVLRRAEFMLKCDDGKERHFIAEPISPFFYFEGGGYHTQGVDKGPFCIEGEQWDVSRPADVGSPIYGSIGMSMNVSKFQLDGESGIGNLEVGYCPDMTREYIPTL